MSPQRIITIRICRRAAYLMSNNLAGTVRILSDRRIIPKHRSHYMTTERQLIARCYQIS